MERSLSVKKFFFFAVNFIDQNIYYFVQLPSAIFQLNSKFHPFRPFYRSQQRIFLVCLLKSTGELKYF